MDLNVTVTWPSIAVNYLTFFFYNKKAVAALKLSLLLYLKLTFTPLIFSI